MSSPPSLSRHPVEVDVKAGSPEQQRAQGEHLARWLTKRLEMPVRLFDLRPHGFDLVGGRLLPDAAGKSAQLMYESTDTGAPKQRVTVYLRKPDANAPTAFRCQQQGELGLFYWVEAGAGYALVGALPKERLLALAQAIYSSSRRRCPPALRRAEASAPACCWQAVSAAYNGPDAARHDRCRRDPTHPRAQGRPVDNELGGCPGLHLRGG